MTPYDQELLMHPMRSLVPLASAIGVLTLSALLAATQAQAQVFRGFGGQTRTHCAASSGNQSVGVPDDAGAGAMETLLGGSIGRFTGQHLDFSLGGITGICSGNDAAYLAFGTVTLYPITLMRRLSLGAAVSGDVDFNQMGITLDESGANDDPYLWVRPEAAARLYLFGFGEQHTGSDGVSFREGGTSIELRVGRYRNRTNYGTLGVSIHFNG